MQMPTGEGKELNLRGGEEARDADQGQELEVDGLEALRVECAGGMALA